MGIRKHEILLASWVRVNEDIRKQNPFLKFILIAALFVVPGSGIVLATYLLLKEIYNLWKRTRLKKLD